MTQLYNILLTGQFNEGTNSKQALASFASASGISVEKAQALFDSAPSIIKRNVDEATAKGYQLKLHAMGIQTELQLVETQADAAPAASPTATRASDSTQKRTIDFKFNGEGYEYFKIWIVNILLTIVTLGLYAPWAKVRNTQYFYGNTQLEGTSFAFTADPVKMLIGRLIALGLFIVFYAVSTFSPITGIVLSIGLVFVLPWVVNKSLAFYARNTSYRNIRFAFRGTYWHAFKTFFLWPIAGVFSLFLLMPLVMQKQQTYIANNHHFGNKSFSFRATIGSYYVLCLVAAGISLLGGFIGFLLGLAIPALGVIGVAAGYIGAIVYFVVAHNNLVLNGLSLAEHDLKAQYEYRSFGILLFVNFLLTVLTLGLYIPWAKVKLAKYASEHVQLDVQGDLNNFIAVSQPDPSAFGEEFGDVFDMEVGF